MHLANALITFGKIPPFNLYSIKVNYVADSKLSILTNLLWMIICVCCSTFAIYLVRESYTMWQKEPVITTLKSVGKPVTEIAFPTVTICSPGLFVENVKVALEKSFNQWRFQGDKGSEESGIPSLMAEFMEEKFQMKDSDNVNIMDILNTMISPKDVESNVAANGVRENIQACASKKNRKRRSAAADATADAPAGNVLLFPTFWKFLVGLLIKSSIKHKTNILKVFSDKKIITSFFKNIQ